MTGGPSLAARALLAALLLVFFYVLALAIAAALLLAPIALLGTHSALVFKLGVVCWIGAAIVLWSVAPRPDRFEAPGPLLERAHEPRLLAELDAIARSSGQRPPDEVYLVAEANAFVAQRGGWLGFGSRRVMGLGLPLLAAFTPDEMRGVIAHEFGHFTGGDTRLGPWVYRTRGALVRTLQNLERGRATLDGSLLLALVRQPFTGYYRFFMRVSQAVSRAQELAADRLGARVAGAPAMASGLAKLEFTSLAFELFLQSEFLPLVQRGLRAPLAAGFQEFLAVPRVRDEVERARSRMQAGRRREPYDSHPPVPERLRALGVDPGAGPAAAAPERALDWCADPAELETRLLAFQTPGTQHRRIEWAQVASTVVAPDWERLCRPHAALLETLTVRELAATARDARALADRLALPPAARERPESFARALLAAALGLALRRAGWELRVSLGHPLQLVSGLEVLEPHATVEELAERRRAEQDWRAWCERAGVAELPLWRA